MDPQFGDVISREDVLQDVMGLSIESHETDVQKTHPAVGGGVLPELLLVVGSDHGFCVGFPGFMGPGILLQKHKGILHAVDPADVTYMDGPGSGVVGAHGEQVLDDVVGCGLWVAPDGTERGQHIQMEHAFHGKLSEKKVQGRNWRALAQFQEPSE